MSATPSSRRAARDQSTQQMWLFSAAPWFTGLRNGNSGSKPVSLQGPKNRDVCLPPVIQASLGLSKHNDGGVVSVM